MSPPADDEIRALILSLCDRRFPKTICPSEVAREAATEWRPLMGRVREVAASLQAEGLLEGLQRNRLVRIGTAQGPLRFRLKREES